MEKRPANVEKMQKSYNSKISMKKKLLMLENEITYFESFEHYLSLQGRYDKIYGLVQVLSR